MSMKFGQRLTGSVMLMVSALTFLIMILLDIITLRLNVVLLMTLIPLIKFTIRLRDGDWR